MCNADASVPSFFKRISNKREYRFTKMFIGSVTGVFVSHPGSLEHCDSSYDPRLRPWYVIGSTAARNMVIFYKLKSS